MKLFRARVTAFQEKILAWYAKNKRDLPWRKTRDPYHIFVSEVMLQQTQVSRVLPKYEAWMRQFPTIESLADAPARDVLALWLGLGYNRRALHLQKTAQIISKEYKSVWPREKEQLKKLPGIGEYTAGAIACFAFNKQVAVVDTNVRKVILLEFMSGSKGTPPRSSSFEGQAREIEGIADQLLPKGNAYEWNQALMDYAAIVLKDKRVLLRKQSAFQGSNRYYRGKLLRILLAKSPRRMMEIGKLLKEDFSAVENTWLATLIFQMERDGFIRTSKGNVSLLSRS